jgi:hypothetical protein
MMAALLCAGLPTPHRWHLEPTARFATAARLTTTARLMAAAATLIPAEQAAQAAQQRAARAAARVAMAHATTRLATTAWLTTAARLGNAAAWLTTTARFAATMVMAIEHAAQTAEQAAARTAVARVAATARLATAIRFATTARLTTTTTTHAAEQAEGIAVRAHGERRAQGERRQEETSVHRRLLTKRGGENIASSAGRGDAQRTRACAGDRNGRLLHGSLGASAEPVALVRPYRRRDASNVISGYRLAKFASLTVPQELPDRAGRNAYEIRALTVVAIVASPIVAGAARAGRKYDCH